MRGPTWALLVSAACQALSAHDNSDGVELVQRVATVIEPDEPSEPLQLSDRPHRKPSQSHSHKKVTKPHSHKEVHRTATVTEPPEHSQPLQPFDQPHHDPQRILIFVPVGSKYTKLIDVQLANVNLVRSFEASQNEVKFDIFFVHYDFARDRFRERVGGDWYDENIRFSTEMHGMKFWMAKQLLQKAESQHSGTQPNINDYDWIWFLDEDGDFKRMDLGKMLASAEDSGSLVVAPSIIFTQDLDTQLSDSECDAACQHGRVECNFQAPKEDCSRRYVAFIELSFPMFRPSAWDVLASAEGAVNEESAWGLDKIWCKLPSNRLGMSYHHVCTILDAHPIVHRNFKTLWKYGNHTANVLNYQTDRKVRSRFPREYDGGLKTFGCVPP